MKRNIRELELLAPARDVEVAREAILHGADAVYIGASSHGARSRAGNSIEDIAGLVGFAAPFGVRIYVTVNTIVYDDEIPQVERLIRDLYRIGVDALIVQDLGILEMDLPPIALHASTQCDTRSPEKARFLRDAGFSQIVIARESSLQETAAICEAVDVPVEAFVHGALCVSYSGDCQASFVTTGRSANRGACAQMCRLPYDLLDGNGAVVARGRHFLSLRDMNRIGSLMELIDAGVTSFKIEGRLKDASYVKNVTAAYRRALDDIIDSNPDRYRRSSRGMTALSFRPSLAKCFNRGYTDYFLHGRQAGKMAVFETPKSLGEEVGTVRAVRKNVISADLSAEIHNGDGLSFVTSNGSVGGFRVNRATATDLFTAGQVTVAPGSRLFRSFDKNWEDAMSRPTAIRQIPLHLTLRLVGDDRVALDGRTEGLGETSVCAVVDRQPAQRPDNGYRSRILSRTGETIFRVDSVDDRLGETFVPASALVALRRDLINALDTMLAAVRRVDRRRPRSPQLKLPEGMSLSRHDNIANRLAARFYGEITGKDDIDSLPRAVEVSRCTKGEMRVMTTRYCLRREMGVCLKTKNATDLKGPLFLRGAGFVYRLDFDCASCRMNVIANPGDRRCSEK